jgi:CubicO group peptidase (beta-lactamase class C family)
MRDHILIPLGAANAIFAKSSEAGSLKLAQGYVPDNFDLEGNHGNNKEGGPLPENYSKIPHDSLSNMVSSAAGGLYISAKELAQIGVNLYNSEGVSYQTLQAMCTTTIPVPRIIFGYGCNGIEHTPDFIKWGASGGAPGVSAELAFYPQQKAVLVILSNHDMRAKPLLQAFEGPLTPESSGQFIIK